MPRGGKRAGAGRKPARPESTWFNTRIDAGTRKLLEREAKFNKRSLSREIEERLRKSFEDGIVAGRWGDHHCFALARLVNELAKAAGGWRQDRFAFESLRFAVGELFEILSQYVPSEPKMTANPDPIDTFGHSESHGRFLARGLWNNLKTAELPLTTELRHELYYRLPALRQRLGIAPGWTPEEAVWFQARSASKP
jgi:hypothetical protein